MALLPARSITTGSAALSSSSVLETSLRTVLGADTVLRFVVAIACLPGLIERLIGRTRGRTLRLSFHPARPGSLAARPNARRRGLVQANRKERPSRRRERCQRAGPTCADSACGKRPSCLCGQCFVRIRRTRENGNDHRVKNFPPALPTVELDQIVRSHQPNESRALEAFGAGFERIGGKARAKQGFERHRLQTRMAPANPGGACKARRQGRHAVVGFERVLRADEQPDLVEIEAFQSFERDMRMALVGGIERAAKQADAALGRQTKSVERRRHAQGRVCPEPRSTYL